jgi:hypothetical protein
MMEAVHTSEMSVYNYFTWQYIPEDNSELTWFYCTWLAISTSGSYYAKNDNRGTD